MKLTKSDLDYELVHKHGGNGWAVAQMLDGNYCRVVAFGRDGSLGKQAFLACADIMNRGPKLDDLVIDSLSTLRNELQSGTKVVVSSWIKKA